MVVYEEVIKLILNGDFEAVLEDSNIVIKHNKELTIIETQIKRTLTVKIKKDAKEIPDEITTLILLNPRIQEISLSDNVKLLIEKLHAQVCKISTKGNSILTFSENTVFTFDKLDCKMMKNSKIFTNNDKIDVGNLKINLSGTSRLNGFNVVNKLSGSLRGISKIINMKCNSGVEKDVECEELCTVNINDQLITSEEGFEKKSNYSYEKKKFILTPEPPSPVLSRRMYSLSLNNNININNNVPYIPEGIEDDETDVESEQCHYCMDKRKILAPDCGHLYYCIACAKRTEETKKCFDCRQPITKFIKVFN